VSFYDPQTQQEKLLVGLKPDDYFIDYVWSTYDPTNQVLYVLRRNEHDPFEQSQKVFAIDIANRKELYEPQIFPIKNSFSNMQWVSTATPKQQGLIAFVQGVPGATNLTHDDFGLYNINPKQGSTEQISLINTDFNVKQWYGGNVFNFNTSPYYYQFFRSGISASSSKVILSCYRQDEWSKAVESDAFNYLYNVVAVPPKN